MVSPNEGADVPTGAQEPPQAISHPSGRSAETPSETPQRRPFEHELHVSEKPQPASAAGEEVARAQETPRLVTECLDKSTAFSNDLSTTYPAARGQTPGVDALIGRDTDLYDNGQSRKARGEEAVQEINGWERPKRNQKDNAVATSDLSDNTHVPNSRNREGDSHSDLNDIRVDSVLPSPLSPFSKLANQMGGLNSVENPSTEDWSHTLHLFSNYRSYESDPDPELVEYMVLATGKCLVPRNLPFVGPVEPLPALDGHVNAVEGNDEQSNLESERADKLTEPSTVPTEAEQLTEETSSECSHPHQQLEPDPVGKFVPVHDQPLRSEDGIPVHANLPQGLNDEAESTSKGLMNTLMQPRPTSTIATLSPKSYNASLTGSQQVMENNSNFYNGTTKPCRDAQDKISAWTRSTIGGINPIPSFRDLGRSINTFATKNMSRVSVPGWKSIQDSFMLRPLREGWLSDVAGGLKSTVVWGRANESPATAETEATEVAAVRERNGLWEALKQGSDTNVPSSLTAKQPSAYGGLQSAFRNSKSMLTAYTTEYAPSIRPGAHLSSAMDSVRSLSTHAYSVPSKLVPTESILSGATGLLDTAKSFMNGVRIG